MTHSYKLLPILLILTGCCYQEADKAEQRKIFMECLDKVKFAPTSTHYSDLDEVIDSCKHASYILTTYTTVCR